MLSKGKLTNQPGMCVWKRPESGDQEMDLREDGLAGRRVLFTWGNPIEIAPVVPVPPPGPPCPHHRMYAAELYGEMGIMPSSTST